MEELILKIKNLILNEYATEKGFESFEQMDEVIDLLKPIMIKIATPKEEKNDEKNTKKKNIAASLLEQAFNSSEKQQEEKTEQNNENEYEIEEDEITIDDENDKHYERYEDTAEYYRQATLGAFSDAFDEDISDANIDDVMDVLGM